MFAAAVTDIDARGLADISASHPLSSPLLPDDSTSFLGPNVVAQGYVRCYHGGTERPCKTRSVGWGCWCVIFASRDTSRRPSWQQTFEETPKDGHSAHTWSKGCGSLHWVSFERYALGSRSPAGSGNVWRTPPTLGLTRRRHSSDTFVFQV
jgi:hypothetical protein